MTTNSSLLNSITVVEICSRNGFILVIHAVVHVVKPRGDMVNCNVGLKSVIILAQGRIS